ncbi:MAG: hypothetical protein M1147_04275 [Nitrospirae bacterium]|nr:hypothetical protein [Nitrospirota bacterium]MCL5977332.1 hypothetical protein [Nitrospirota bacterium]
MKHTTGIGGSVSKLEEMRRRLESTQLNAVRELLTDRKGEKGTGYFFQPSAHTKPVAESGREGRVRLCHFFEREIFNAYVDNI